MATLKETAENYEAPKIKNIADLDKVKIDDVLIQEENDVDFPYSYFMLEGEKYKVPKSVLMALQDILLENPKLTYIKVKKSGEGLKTKYTVIPL